MSGIIKKNNKTVVIGGGAAGMLAAIFSAQKGNSVVLIEKNEKLGKKIYITGKGRCNLTNDCSVEFFLENVVRNSVFLKSCLYSFSPEKTMNFFEENGLKLKVERGNRVFPLSDKASDITFTLEKLLKKLNVNILLNTIVKEILVENNSIKGVLTNNSNIQCDSVVIATGGKSYPLTGSTGDGYKFAKKLGHKIVDIVPSLTGINLISTENIALQGLSLKNVVLTATYNDKVVFSQMGEMLFAHFGISGPLVLSCSAIINRLDLSKVSLKIDFKPALSLEKLENRLIRDFSENNKKNISSVIKGLLPSKLVEIFISRIKEIKNKNCSEITTKDRDKIVFLLKNFSLKIQSLRNIEEAIVTSGGVSVNEINPRTMESKIIKNLFFAGEVIDVDCFTGGFNLQTAFSTGFMAGNNC